MPDLALKASLGCGNPTALAELKPGETVLDLGSGGGIDVLLSARRVGPTGKAYGLDMTDEMLALAEENKRKSGLENVEFLKGEIENIPLPDNSVDVIISNCVINLSGDKDRVLREAFRVLKPGGRFAVSDVVVRGEVPAAIRKSMELWVGCVAGALGDYEYVAKLAKAGFDDIDIETDARLQHRGCADVPRRRRPRRRRARQGHGGHVHQRVRPRDEAGRRDLLRTELLPQERPGMNLPRRVAAEAIGTALLLAAVVGSGIMGERLAGGNVALALLANTIATGATLAALIFDLRAGLGRALQSGGDPGGRHPGRTAVARRPALRRRAARRRGRRGAFRPCHVRRAASRDLTARSCGQAQLFSEFIATFGLLAVIWGCSRRAEAVPVAVGLYITGAYWFTASTSFANPAVTLARTLTNTFAGIRPVDAPGFIVAQFAGAVAATVLFRWLVPALPQSAQRVVVLVSEPSALMNTVLFACVHNAGRSQMAAAWFNVLADPSKARAISAGTDPGARVHPEVVEAMNEVGVDLADATDHTADRGCCATGTDADHDGVRRPMPRCSWPAARRLAVRGSRKANPSNESAIDFTPTAVDEVVIVGHGFPKRFIGR